MRDISTIAAVSICTRGLKKRNKQAYEIIKKRLSFIIKDIFSVSKILLIINPKTKGNERSIITVSNWRTNNKNIVNLICFAKWTIKLNNFSGGTLPLPNRIGSVILSKKLSLCLEKVFICF